jgi:hypothetical protein
LKTGKVSPKELDTIVCRLKPCGAGILPVATSHGSIRFLLGGKYKPENTVNQNYIHIEYIRSDLELWILFLFSSTKGISMNTWVIHAPDQVIPSDAFRPIQIPEYLVAEDHQFRVSGTVIADTNGPSMNQGKYNKLSQVSRIFTRCVPIFTTKNKANMDLALAGHIMELEICLLR